MRTYPYPLIHRDSLRNSDHPDHTGGALVLLRRGEWLALQRILNAAPDGPDRVAVAQLICDPKTLAAGEQFDDLPAAPANSAEHAEQAKRA